MTFSWQVVCAVVTGSAAKLSLFVLRHTRCSSWTAIAWRIANADI